MKRSTFIRMALGASATLGAGVSMTPAISRGEPTADVPATAKNRSLQLEMERAIEKGLAFLKSKQDTAGGFWSGADYPALTGLALLSFMEQPGADSRSKQPEFVEKGYKYLLGCAKPDGGIYGKVLANYNTCVAVMALNAADREEYGAAIRKARAYIVGAQNFYPKQDGKISPYQGGIGYGDDGPHSDVSNTTFALEALKATR